MTSIKNTMCLFNFLIMNDIIKPEHYKRVQQYYKDNDNENIFKIYAAHSTFVKNYESYPGGVGIYESYSNEVNFNIKSIDKIITENSKMLGYDLKIKPEIFIFLHSIFMEYESYEDLKNKKTLRSLNKEIEGIEKLERLFVNEDLKKNNDRTNIKMKEIVFSINGKDVKIVRNAKKNEETTIEANSLLTLIGFNLADKIYHQITERKEFLIQFVQKFKDKKGSKPTDQRVVKTFIRNSVKPFYNFLCDHTETKSSIYLFLVEILQAIGFDTNEETIKRALLE